MKRAAKRMLANYLSSKGHQFKTQKMSTVMGKFFDEIKSMIKIYVIARVLGTVALFVILVILLIFFIRSF